MRPPGAQVVEEPRPAPAQRGRHHLRQWAHAPVQPALVVVQRLVHPRLERPQRAHLQREHALRRRDVAEVGGDHPGRHRAQRPVARRGGRPLRPPEVGVAEHADGPGAPRLRGDPVERVVAVGDLGAERRQLAVGAQLAPHVLRDDGVAALGEPSRDGRHEALVAGLVVRQPGQQHRPAPARARQVDVGRQPDAVSHPHRVRTGLVRNLGERPPDGAARPPRVARCDEPVGELHAGRVPTQLSYTYRDVVY